MKKLLSIFDAFLLPNNKLVLGGINSNLDNLWAQEMKELIKGKHIILKRPGLDDVTLNVLDVEVTNSLIDKKNFFFLINENLTPKDIIKNSIIYYE
jgi:hypothetical protein